jgi:hypothetical protein
MRRLLACLGLVLGGCYVYSPHSYVDLGRPFAGARVELGGCLDVTVGYAEDPEAMLGKVIEYSFGNHCAHRVTVDLASIRAVEIGPDRVTRRLVAHDPRDELRPLELDGWWLGHERIEYVAENRVPGDPRSSICVEVGGLDRSAPRLERWVCTGSSVTETMPGLPPGGPS